MRMRNIVGLRLGQSGDPVDEPTVTVRFSFPHRIHASLACMRMRECWFTSPMHATIREIEDGGLHGLRKRLRDVKPTNRMHSHSHVSIRALLQITCMVLVEDARAKMQVYLGGAYGSGFRPLRAGFNDHLYEA